MLHYKVQVPVPSLQILNKGVQSFYVKAKTQILQFILENFHVLFTVKPLSFSRLRTSSNLL